MYQLVRDARFGFKDARANKHLRILVLEISHHARKTVSNWGQLRNKMKEIYYIFLHVTGVALNKSPSEINEFDLKKYNNATHWLVSPAAAFPVAWRPYGAETTHW